MVTNPNHISGLNTTDQIRDNTDHIHSGIIKALNSMVGGNMVIEGCNVTQTTSGARTQFDVANGKYLRDGQLVSFSASSVTLASNQVSSATANYDYYLLLVFTSGGGLAIRGDNSLINATSPKVASFNPHDTVICTIKIAGADPDNASREIQFLTADKPKNAVSVAYSDGGTYTETLSLIGGVGGTTISNKLGDLTIQDGSTGGIIIAGDKVGLGGTSPSKDIHIERDSGTDELVFIKNTSTTGNKGLFIETRGSDTDLAFDITTTGGTSKASIDSTGKIVNASDMELGGNLQVGGNIIKASDGGSTITMDTNDNVTIAGDLTVAGGDILGPTDGALTIKADTDMIFRIDADSDGAETFQFQTNNGNEVMSLDEAGNLQIDGDLNISGGNLVTTAVTADLEFTAAAGLQSAADHYITNNGGKYEGFIYAAGLLAADSPTGSDLGMVTHVIEPLLSDATANPISFRNEVVYLGTSVKNQTFTQEIKEAGIPTHIKYDMLVEGINAPAPINGLIGGGGFVCIDSPDVASVSKKKITLVNTSNVPCYILTASSSGSPTYGYPGFHKGLKTRDYLRTDISQNTVNLSRCLETSAYNGYNSQSNIFIPTNGETAYLLKAGCSVTLHAIQLTQESDPAYQVQEFQGFFPQDPRAYWMVRNSAEGTITGKIAHNTTMPSIVLGPAQSGYSIYASFPLGQFIILPPTPAIGTQYFIYAMHDVTVICRNAANGTTDAGGTTATDVIRDSGADVNTKSMGSGTMATFIYGPDNKWLVVG